MTTSPFIVGRIGRYAAAAVALIACAFSPDSVRAQTTLQLPDGFHASVYASGIPNPTAMAFGPDGRLYVSQVNGKIVAVGHTGITTIASGFSTPLGLAWNGGKLYVSSTGEISTLTARNRYTSFPRDVIVRGLPYNHHQNDGLAFHGGWLYVGVGSTCNACLEADPRSATVMRFRYDGSHSEVYARGVRNPYGLAFQPATGDLYATDNGRDDYGNSVPEELNRIVQGGNYGWPDCWGNGGGTNCSGTIAPAAVFEPHSSADGIAFYTGYSFPKSYRGDAFVAEWGDIVNNAGTGHRIKRVHFSNATTTVSDFVTGLSHPLAVTNAPGGALLVADFGTGIIWSIQANGH